MAMGSKVTGRLLSEFTMRFLKGEDGVLLTFTHPSGSKSAVAVIHEDFITDYSNLFSKELWEQLNRGEVVDVALIRMS